MKFDSDNIRKIRPMALAYWLRVNFGDNIQERQAKQMFEQIISEILKKHKLCSVLIKQRHDRMMSFNLSAIECINSQRDCEFCPIANSKKEVRGLEEWVK